MMRDQRGPAQFFPLSPFPPFQPVCLSVCLSLRRMFRAAAAAAQNICIGKRRKQTAQCLSSNEGGLCLASGVPSLGGDERTNESVRSLVRSIARSLAKKPDRLKWVRSINLLII